MARYEKGHKEETRRRVVEIAAERFRSDGIERVGVASLMADAGLTHGGFYAHFPSKEALVKEAVLFALNETPTSGLDLRSFIETYLSPEHRDGAAKGCAVAALGPEMARRPRSTRNAFGKAIQRQAAHIASGLPEAAAPESNIAIAWEVYAQIIGCLQLSRIVSDKKLSGSLLSRGRMNALRMAGLDSAKLPPAKEGKKKAKSR
jgi:TetR/AcrR family transcriptional repressor of nem operon